MSLYEATRDLHHAAEAHPFAKAMMAGDISRQAWADWCGAMARIHGRIDPHAPPPLRRLNELQADLVNLLPVTPRHCASVTEYLREMTEPETIGGAIYIFAGAHLRGGAVLRKRLAPTGLPCRHLHFDSGAREANEALTELRSETAYANGARRAFHATVALMDEIEEARHA